MSRPRYRLQFGLTGLLLAVSIFCAWCAFHANRGRYERALEKRIVAARGTVGYGRIDWSDTHSRLPATWRERLLRNVFGQRHISSVEFYDWPVGRDLLQPVCALPFLESLKLAECKLCDEDLECLPRAKGLVVLYIEQAPVSHRGLRGIASLVRLKHISVRGTRADDETLRIIASLPDLITANVSATQVTGIGVPPFVSPSLIRFGGEKTAIGDPYLTSLAKSNALEDIFLEQTRITDEGIRTLRGHPSLRYLAVAGNPLTNASLDVFAEMPRLQRANVSGKGFTKEAVKQFRAKHPGIL